MPEALFVHGDHRNISISGPDGEIDLVPVVLTIRAGGTHKANQIDPTGLAIDNDGLVQKDSDFITRFKIIRVTDVGGAQHEGKNNG